VEAKPETASRCADAWSGCSTSLGHGVKGPARNQPGGGAISIPFCRREPSSAEGTTRLCPFDEVPAFMNALREREGVAPRALEFAILTATRSGEVLGARWAEFDLEARVWIVPAARTKAGREHRVPLSAPTVEILRQMDQKRLSDYVFPGARSGRPLSTVALNRVLGRMKVDVTVHGFRSAFRDWAGERTHFPREVAEAALAHLVGDAVERAYRRGDALEKRRKLMDAWAASLTSCREAISCASVPAPQALGAKALDFEVSGA
jgi:integrase